VKKALLIIQIASARTRTGHTHVLLTDPTAHYFSCGITQAHLVSLVAVEGRTEKSPCVDDLVEHPAHKFPRFGRG